MRRSGPLDYAYLKALTPMAQRFYELLSYKMFAALKHRQPHATLRYSEYCLLSTQQRYTEAMPMQKADVQGPSAACALGLSDQGPCTPRRPTPTASPTGSCTTPRVPKRVPSIRTFRRQPGAEAAAALPSSMDADQEALRGTVTQAPSGAPRHDERPASHAACHWQTGTSRHTRPYAQHRRPTLPVRQSQRRGRGLPCQPTRSRPRRTPWYSSSTSASMGSPR